MQCFCFLFTFSLNNMELAKNSDHNLQNVTDNYSHVHDFWTYGNRFPISISFLGELPF